MRKTGPTKDSTRKLVVELEKHGKKAKSKVFVDLSKRIAKPRRLRCSANLWKVSLVFGKEKGKTVVVPGKVLGTGSAAEGLNVAALEFSEAALKKISGAKGKALTLGELMKANPKASNLVIVK